MSTITVRTIAEADAIALQIHAAAEHLQDHLMSMPRGGLSMLRALKFDMIGRHPIEDRSLNAIEQINQTWTWLAALAAVKELLRIHPEAGALHLAPGAHASQALDVMSETDGLVGAETFAAVDPRNNRKLANDLNKLSGRPERHRYVFFASPLYPGTQRLVKLERDGVQVWSVDV